MYSCKYAGGLRAHWGLGSDGTGIGIRSVAEGVVSSCCSAWCGVEAEGSGVGGRNRSGGAEGCCHGWGCSAISSHSSSSRVGRIDWYDGVGRVCGIA